MPDLVNCANCDQIMVANQFRDICEDCYEEEEKQFEIVYKYMRKRENRAATMKQVVEAIDVSENCYLNLSKVDEFKSNSFRTLATHVTNVERLFKQENFA